jgi:uncharacterized iron-regulated membrane protein
MRWLFLTHRYLGIAVGALMVIWCLSGVVMMYVRYPELKPRERLQRLQPIDWQNCCVVSDVALADDARIDSIEVEMIAGRPVARVQPVGGPTRLIDLGDGHILGALSVQQAGAVAAAFARAASYSGEPRFEGLIEYDQWTVSGEFKRARPLYRFALADAAATRLYVSATTGKVVQSTNAHERLWNWLGAIPHWLYFTQLRRNVALWSEIVIWTSIVGCFLTVTGIYLGVRQFLRRPGGRWSPYSGINFWHHLPGLIFGLFTLTWVASGLISMNPWGFLDGGDSRRLAQRLLRGEPLTGSQVKSSLHSLPAVARLPEIVSVQSTPLWGKLFLTVATQQGARWRFDAAGSSARLDGAEWMRIGHALTGHDVSAPDLITQGDSYYFDRRGNEALLPAYRIVTDDAQRVRYYLDPLTASLVASFDGDARWYRWLHQGLHTMDLTSSLRARPGWDFLMLALLSGVTTICVTGTYLAMRRVLSPP